MHIHKIVSIFPWEFASPLNALHRHFRERSLTLLIIKVDGLPNEYLVLYTKFAAEKSIHKIILC